MNDKENKENSDTQKNKIITDAQKSSQTHDEDDQSVQTRKTLDSENSENSITGEKDSTGQVYEQGTHEHNGEDNAEPLQAIVIEETDDDDLADDFFELVAEDDDEEEEQVEPEEKDSSEITRQLEVQLAKKENEARENFDRVVRLQAEFENFKKRNYKEKQEFKKHCLEGIILELIPNLDNLERGLQSAEQTPDIEKIIEGIKMIQRGFLNSLIKFGMKPIETENELFDPAKHEAMMIVDTTDHKNNMIIEEFQKGYYLHERVIKPSLVSVAKHVAAVEEENEEPDDQISSAMEEISLQLKHQKENDASVDSLTDTTTVSDQNSEDNENV